LSWPRLFLWVSAAAGIAFFLISIYRINKSDSRFLIVDLIMEGDPPKASLNKLTIIVFAALSVWAVINAVLDNKIDPIVVNLLLGVLGIFVVSQRASQAISQLSRKPTEVSSDPEPPAKRSVLK
jgi:xanthosine utilization system XapX-like protein